MNPEDDLVTSPEQWAGMVGLLLGILVVWVLVICLKEVVRWAWRHRTPGIASRQAAMEAHPRYEELQRAKGHLGFAKHMARATRDEHRSYGRCQHCEFVLDVKESREKLAELEQEIKEEVAA